MRKIVNKAVGVIHNLFANMLLLYLIFLLIETLWKGSVSSRINLNYFLIIVIVMGIITVLTQREERKEKKEKIEITKKDYIMVSAFSILGAVIVWYKIKDIGKIAYVVSIIAGVLIFLLSIIIMEGEENEYLGNVKNNNR